jgi:hypothetical protein
MNTKIRNHRGGALSLVVTLSVMLLLSFSAQAADAFLNGTTTNNLVAYNAPWGTNSSGNMVVTNNYYNGQVPGASNVFYQVSTLNGAQPYFGTNGYLPALVLNLKGGFENSLTAPAKDCTIAVNASLMATNSTSTALTFQFYGMDADGLVVETNLQTITLTIPVNSLGTTTNGTFQSFDTLALGYVGLQQINNPGAAAVTNIIVSLHSKSGL